MEAADKSAAGKQFEAPPAGRAALYVYREGSFGAANLVTAWLGQRTLGQLGSDTWFRVEVEPGAQQLRCTTSEASQLLDVNLAAGDVRFVEIAMRLGFATARCAIFEVSPEKGRAAVSAGKRALLQ